MFLSKPPQAQPSQRERKCEPAPSYYSARIDCAHTEATSFLGWIRKSGVTQAFAPELSRLYNQYVTETQSPPVPELVLRRQLAKLTGVSKSQGEVIDELGRRWRPTSWQFDLEVQ
jgi:hypothetical protein